MSNDLWGGMISFKPGWLCGSKLDNARTVFACVIVGGCVNDVIPVSMVCGTGVLVLRYLLGFSVRGLSKALGMGSGVVVISSFLRNM